MQVFVFSRHFTVSSAPVYGFLLCPPQAEVAAVTVTGPKLVLPSARNIHVPPVAEGDVNEKCC